MKFKLFNNLKSDGVRQAYRQGYKQKDKVQNYNWWDRNIANRYMYKTDVQKLYDIDKKVTRKKQDLLANRAFAALGASTLVGAGIGGASVFSDIKREKTASSRLLQILKGTKVKQLKQSQDEVGKILSNFSNNNATAQKTIDVIDKDYTNISKKLRKERIYTNLSRGTLGAGGIMGVLKANQKPKEKRASLSKAQKIALGVIPAVGTATGATAVLATNDIENSAKNIASGAAIGAGTTGAFSGGAYFLIKNPHLLNKLKNLTNQ